MSEGRAAFCPEGKWQMTETTPERMWFFYTTTLWLSYNPEHSICPQHPHCLTVAEREHPGRRARNPMQHSLLCPEAPRQAWLQPLTGQFTWLEGCSPMGTDSTYQKCSQGFIYLYADKQNIDFWGFRSSIRGLMMSPRLASLEFLGWLTFWCINQLRASTLLNGQYS